MRKGTSRYDNFPNSPIYHLPQPIVAPPEVFTEVTEQMVENVRPYYLISTYGRLYHKYRNEFLAVNIDSKGYIYKPLTTNDGTSKNVRIHRLVMMAFCPIPNCNDMLINHIDGNKANDCIWNLEWCTYSENMVHALKTGLKDGPWLEADKVREICSLLEDCNNTISKVAEITGASYSQVQSIQGKRSYTDISDEYNIQKRKINTNFEMEQVHALCLWFQSNPKPKTEILDNYCTRAIQSIGYDNSDEITSNLIRTAKKIYTKETYKYVSCYYNF